METRPLHSPAWACRSEDLPARAASDLISDKPNRWNAEGEPTIYLCGDAALALVEQGRHPDDLKEHSRLIEVAVQVSSAVDLRVREVRTGLALPDDPTWILDRERTREVAASLRRSGRCHALIVPSAGALDQPERWNVVVFADEPETVDSVISAPREVGTLVLRAGPPRDAQDPR